MLSTNMILELCRVAFDWRETLSVKCSQYYLRELLENVPIRKYNLDLQQGLKYRLGQNIVYDELKNDLEERSAPNGC